ncbi:MAG: PEP-CTERM sorting domain-containing protein [Chthoniobacterales bacterium]
MKTLRYTAAILLTSVAASSSVFAAAPGFNPATNWSSGTSVTNQFNTSAGYDAGSSLDGAPTSAPLADQWKTTDPFNGSEGSTSLLAFTPGYTALNFASGNQSVLFGGYDLGGGVVPGIANPSLFRDFSSLITVSKEQVSFIADFGIVPSTGGFTNDVFGFSFANAGGTSLASVQFTNAGPLPGDLRVLANGADTGQWSYNSLYRLTATFSNSTFSLDLAGLSPQTNGGGQITNYSVTGSASYVNGATILNSLTAADFQRASINWELTGGTNAPGDNYMIVNSTQVVSQVVPEPGTWAAAALLLGGAALVVRRRRVAAAQA